jgi:hypothetical protein
MVVILEKFFKWLFIICVLGIIPCHAAVYPKIATEAFHPDRTNRSKCDLKKKCKLHRGTLYDLI